MGSLRLSDSDRKRFEAKYIPVTESGCWLWTASALSNGYGAFGIGKSVVPAHRASWLIHRGDLPKDAHIDHTCCVRCCVNPSHLEAVTQAENNRRTNQRGRNGQSAKTHCPRGHPYDETNTRMYEGRRFCRACRHDLWVEQGK